MKSERKVDAMFDKSLLEGFELVPITRRARSGNGLITIDKNRRKLHISSAYAAELGWRDGERLDLRRSKQGTTFALVPSSVGLLTAHQTMSQTRSLTVNSTDMCHKIRAVTGGCDKFEGWVAEDTLFFKPTKGDEE